MNTTYESLFTALLLLARVSIAAPFLVSGVHKGIWYEKAAAEFREAAVPLPGVLLPVTIVLHLLAPLCLIFGIYSVQAAIALIVFTILATIKVHGFWRFGGEQRLLQSRIALGNLALIGGLLLVALAETGRLS